MALGDSERSFEYARRRGLDVLAATRDRLFREGRFLIIQFRQIGDVLLTLPLAGAIKRQAPGATVAFLTEPVAQPLVENHRAVDRVIVRTRRAGLRGDLDVLKQVRAFKPDVVIDGIRTPSSGIFGLFSGAAIRIAQDHPVRRLFYSLTIVPKLACGYTLDEKLLLAQALGFSPFEGDFRRIGIIPDGASFAKVDQFLNEQGLTGPAPLIIVSPTSRRVTRRWPGAHFARLIDLLARRCGARSILVWGPGEESYVRDIAARCTEPVSVFFRSSLLELTALIARGSLLIGNDSAPRHIAFSQGIPTAVIHGSTGAGAWTPPLPDHQAFSMNLTCQPCRRQTCRLKTLECLTDLRPEDLVDPIARQLASFDPRRSHDHSAEKDG